METKKANKDLEQRLAAIAQFLADQKADEIFVHRFAEGAPVADAIVVATAGSRRHAQGVADNLLRQCPAASGDFLRMEGYDEAQWILLDCNDIIVHIFQADVRGLYKLEDLCRQAAASRKEIHS